MQPVPGTVATAPSNRPQILFWTGIGLIVLGIVLQFGFNLILSLGDYDLYRALGWFNFGTVLIPLGTVLGVFGGAAIGTRMALREAGILQAPAPGPASTGPHQSSPGHLG